MDPETKDFCMTWECFLDEVEEDQKIVCEILGEDCRNCRQCI